MRVGGLGGLSLGLPELFQLESLQAAGQPVEATFGKAKQILMISPQGAATQHETWDPKPETPLEIRGTFGAVETAVPGTYFANLILTYLEDEQCLQF